MTKLVTEEELQEHLESIKKSLEILYSVTLGKKECKLEVEELIPTEPFLERDKLQIVMKKVLEEDYDVSIIVLKYGNDFYILDGHHRAYAYHVLKKPMINAIILEFPHDTKYRTVERMYIGDMQVKSVKKPEVEEGHATYKGLIGMWEKAGKTALYFEKIHGVEFTIIRKGVPVSSLIPTQPYVESSKIESYVNLDIPIICIEHGKKLYIVDGHNRAIVAHRSGAKEMSALVLVPQKPVDFGIVKTAERWGLKSLNDLKMK